MTKELEANQMLTIIRRHGDIAPELFPETSSTSLGYWEALDKGELRAQQCIACGRYRVPPTPVCPHCGKSAAKWSLLSGTGTVFSWIRYHKAYLPTYTTVPYTVITAELEEGVRVYGRLLDRSGEQSTRRPTIGEEVKAVVEEWANGLRTVAFREETNDRNPL